MNDNYFRSVNSEKSPKNLDDSNNTDRNVLITSEKSPAKSLNHKICEVKSPEVSTCKILNEFRGIQRSAKRKRSETRRNFQANKKLEVNLLKISKSPLPKNSVNDVERNVNKPLNYEENSRKEISLNVVNKLINTTVLSDESLCKTPVFKSDKIISPEKSPSSNEEYGIDKVKKCSSSGLFDCSTPNKKGNNYVKSCHIRSNFIEKIDSPCKKEINTISYETQENLEIKTKLEDTNNDSLQTASEIEKIMKKQSTSEILDVPINFKGRKRKKKCQPGSLLDRFNNISKGVEKDMLLFSYELNVGLRQSFGRFVSNDLTVINLYKFNRYQAVYCKVTDKKCEFKHDLNDKYLIKYKIIIISNKLSELIVPNSVINLHFPLIIMWDPQTSALYIFTGNRVAIKETPLGITENKPRKPADEKILNNFDDLFLKNVQQTNLPIVIRTLNSNNVESILECVVAQPLIFEIKLDVILLHVYKLKKDWSSWNVIICDKQDQYCEIEFDSECAKLCNLDFKNLIELEGSKVQITGIKLCKYMQLDSSFINLTNYLHINKGKTNITYIAHTVNSVFNIICIQKCLWSKNCTSLAFILGEAKDFKRYKIVVNSYKITAVGLEILDGSVNEGVTVNITNLLNFNEMETPFIIDAVYYKKNELHTDKYSKIYR